MEQCQDHSAHRRAILSHDSRLDSHSESIDQLRDCVTRLTALQEADAEWRKDAEARLDALESVPSSRWGALVNSGISALGGGLVGSALILFGLE